MTFQVAVLAGDGIGQEVMPQALKILDKISHKFQYHFELTHALIGGAAFDQFGIHFPDETKNICNNAEAILFGSVGGPIKDSHLPKWKDCEKNSILALRKNCRLNINIRLAKIYPALSALCPLKEKLVQSGLDIIIFRELIGDIYFGEHKQWTENNLRYARDIADYNESQISSIAHFAFMLANHRKKRVISVDKANVLDTSKLWREVVTEVSKHYQEVTLEHMLVDNCAMQLFINPSQFDVILTSNLFGDILSDAAAALPGSLGLMPSASLGQSGIGLYEPSGGSAPDIAGLDIANPIAQILSVALMLRYSFKLETEAQAIENAVQKALHEGYRTKDIAINENASLEKVVGTSEMGDVIASFI